jgi:LysM repeat protein
MARTHTVVAGDTLSAIALRFYGDANLFPLIAAANGIANPNVITVGQVLTIPDLPSQAPLQPFSHALGLGWSNHETEADARPFTVPAGKRLVLEDISIAAVMDRGQALTVNLIRVDLEGHHLRHGIPVIHQMSTSSPSPTSHYAGGRPIRVYLESGETLSAHAKRDTDTRGAFVDIFVYGYFMDVSP